MKSMIRGVRPCTLTAIACLLLLGCSAPGDEINESAAYQQEHRREGAESHAVRQRLNHAWARAVENDFSGVALVRHKGREIGRFAAGDRQREKHLPNTFKSAYCIGSITKQFTAAVIMHLNELGQLRLEDTLGELLDDVPADKANITVHQLLTHTAGFPSALGYDDEPIERDAYLELAWRSPLSLPPGKRFWYSNVGYSILAAIIEHRTGTPYEEYLSRELLRPAGLNQTGYASVAWRPRDVASGYLEEEVDRPLQRPHTEEGHYWHLNGNGGLLSTVSDLTRWSDALLGGNVLASETVALMLSPHVNVGSGGSEHYAYGWAVEDTAVGRLVTHNGGNGFFLAELRQYVEADLLVVMLANQANAAAENLALDLADAVYPELPAATEIPEPAAPWAIDRSDEFQSATESFVEAVEFSADRKSAIAGVSIRLQEGTATYRVIDPEGQVFAEGHASPGLTVQPIMEIPRRLGRWEFELHLERATGESIMAWVWE